MGTRMRSLFGAAVVVFGVTTSAAGQSASLHRGIVHDHMGAPMQGAVVTIEHPDRTEVRVVLTDLWGEYEVGELDRDTRYNVRISHPGFRKARLQASAGDHVNVTLKPRRSSQRAAPPTTTVALR